MGMKGNEGKGTGRNTPDRKNSDNYVFTNTADVDFRTLNICRGWKTLLPREKYCYFNQMFLRSELKYSSSKVGGGCE